MTMRAVLNFTVLALIASTVSGFVPSGSRTCTSPSRFGGLKAIYDDDLEEAADRQLAYGAGKADTTLAKRFGSLAGRKVKTVGEAFADFTERMGQPMNALYRNTLTDIVGTTHLISVNARFQRDGVWSLGLLSALDLLLKNYPERDIAKKAVSSLIECVDMDEDEIRKEAKEVADWVKGKSKDDILAALRGEGSGPIAAIGKASKGDDYWMYSKYFGLGLVQVMEMVGIEQNKDACYSAMEEFMGENGMNKFSFTACADSDTWFRVKDKLDMMETLMKEIEIREKKRMAERLEDRAEMALKKAEQEAEWAKEVEADKKEEVRAE